MCHSSSVQKDRNVVFTLTPTNGVCNPVRSLPIKTELYSVINLPSAYITERVHATLSVPATSQTSNGAQPRGTHGRYSYIRMDSYFVVFYKRKQPQGSPAAGVVA